MIGHGSDGLLSFVAALIETDGGRDAALGLAAHCRCADLLIFARDSRTGSYLPVGLPGPLPRRDHWAELLKANFTDSSNIDFPRFPDGEPRPAEILRIHEVCFVFLAPQTALPADLTQALRAIAHYLILRMSLLDVEQMAVADLSELATERVDVDFSARTVDIAGRMAEPPRPDELLVQPGLKAQAYPKLLDQLLGHLLENALRHARTNARPRVEVGMEPDGSLFIRDNGEGFQPQSAQTILRPFRKLGGSKRLGLGLAICDRIVQLHGGRLWLEGRPGQGSTVYLTLGRPAKPPDDENPTQARLNCLEAAFNAAADALVVTDADLDPPGPRILAVNKAFEAMTGWTAAEILGKTPRVLQGQDTDRAEMARLKAALRQGRNFFGEAVNYRKDGTRFILQWKISPILDRTGKPQFYIAIQRDVTSDKARARALVEAQDAATARAKRQEAFAQMIAHDLRSPARRIVSFADLARQTEGKTRHEMLDRVASNAKDLVAMIDSLYEFVAQEKHITPALVDLSALARETARRLVQSDPSRKARLNIQSGMRAVGDPRVAATVLENLLSNAWKFTSGRPTTEIAVTGRREGRMIWISVRDNGIGFEPSLAATLFEPFTRLVTKSAFPGTGLGLAIVKRLVELMGGSVQAHTEGNQGAVFEFSLPIGA